jgi:hypothetical protein
MIRMSLTLAMTVVLLLVASLWATYGGFSTGRSQQPTPESRTVDLQGLTVAREPDPPEGGLDHDLTAAGQGTSEVAQVRAPAPFLEAASPAAEPDPVTKRAPPATEPVSGATESPVDEKPPEDPDVLEVPLGPPDTLGLAERGDLIRRLLAVYARLQPSD